MMPNIVVMSPRTDVKADVERNHLIKIGPSRVEANVIPALSWGTAGQAPKTAQFSISPPSTQTIVDRNVRIKIYLEVKADNPFQIGLNSAVRQYPIASITDTIVTQINGETFSQNTADFIHSLGSYNTGALERNKSLSTTAAMPDSYQEYSDWATYGSGKNPLSSYGENSYEQTRGGINYKIAPDAKSFRVELTEPFFLSPFYSGHGDEQEGFVNINQMNITFRWTSLLRKIISQSTLGGSLGNIDVSFYQAPEILINYLTPDLTQMLPSVQTLPYVQQQEYIRPVGIVQPNASVTLLSDSVKLSMIPDRMYLFCRHTRSSMTENTSDSFLKINRVRVNWNNQSSLLGTASQEQLFEMSSRAGLDMTFPQFQNYRGSVFCLQYGKDIGLLDSECPGVAGQYTVSTQIDITNTSSVAGDFEFFMVFSMGGMVSIFENGCRASIGNLTQGDVLEARMNAPRMDYHEANRLSGGGFFDGLKRFANNVSRGVENVSRVVGDVASAIPLPFAQQVAQGARSVGNIARSIKNETGGRLVGGRASGGSMLSRRRM